MATQRTSESNIETNSNESSYVLRQYLSGRNETDDGEWQKMNGGADGNSECSSSPDVLESVSWAQTNAPCNASSGGIPSARPIAATNEAFGPKSTFHPKIEDNPSTQPNSTGFETPSPRHIHNQDIEGSPDTKSISATPSPEPVYKTRNSKLVPDPSCPIVHKQESRTVKVPRCPMSRKQDLEVQIKLESSASAQQVDRLDNDEHRKNHHEDSNDCNLSEFTTNNGDEATEVNPEFELKSDDPEDLAWSNDEPTPMQQHQPENSSNIWTLPPDKDTCTLEEIRRGQVINKVAPNECPVIGCGKKINEMRAEPSPGTISSGLRTHVLFVHYAQTCRRAPKKKKLSWSGKRRGSTSPKKQFTLPEGSNDDPDFDMEPENFAMPHDMQHSSLSATSLLQRSLNTQNYSSPPGTALSRKIKQLAANNNQTHQSSLQSLMQATGLNFGANNGSKFSPQSKQKGHDLGASQKSFNQTTSSLFSILAGLTQQQSQQNQHQLQLNPTNNHHQAQLGANLSLSSPNRQQQQVSRSAKPAHSVSNTLSLTQCSRNVNNANFINNPPLSSSLLTLLNEKISGNVASSLQSQLKKSNETSQPKTPATTCSRVNVSQTNTNQCNPNDNQNYNNINNALLNSLNMNNGENGSPSLNPFIESVARKTGSNIGPGGIAEVKKIIEKFATWLMYSSQTIADHYIAPYAGEAPQHKPEISASDVILAYKMMQKSQP